MLIFLSIMDFSFSQFLRDMHVSTSGLTFCLFPSDLAQLNIEECNSKRQLELTARSYVLTEMKFTRRVDNKVERLA